MRSIIIKISMLSVLVSAVSIISFGVADADQAPAATKFYPLVGKWKGKGNLSEPGQKTVQLDMSLACRKVSGGWAIACDMNAKNKEMEINESDLMGVDPVTGNGHWFAITNMGETHDHSADWENENTMNASYAWQQDGKKMEEKVVFNFKSKSSMEFHSVVTMEGQIVGDFSGSLKK